MQIVKREVEDVSSGESCNEACLVEMLPLLTYETATKVEQLRNVVYFPLSRTLNSST
jgi:hypothetical protein